MPGARILKMVVRKLTAPRIEAGAHQDQADQPQVGADALRVVVASGA